MALSQEAIDEFVVAAHADLDAVRASLERHPELLTASARWNETAIQAASHVGSRHVVEYLLARGAPLDLHTAAMLGDAERVRAMLDERPGLAAAPGVHGIPSLFFAALSGRIEVAELLLAGGAGPNDGAGGNTPLHATALRNQIEMARWLLAHGADPTATDYEGKTATARAEERGYRELAAVLAAGAGR